MKWKDKIAYIQDNCEISDFEYSLRFVFVYGQSGENADIDLVIWYEKVDGSIDCYLTFLNKFYMFRYINCDIDGFITLRNNIINFLARKLYEWEC